MENLRLANETIVTLHANYIKGNSNKANKCMNKQLKIKQTKTTQYSKPQIKFDTLKIKELPKNTKK